MKRKADLYDKITLTKIIDIYITGVRRNTKNKVKIRKFEDYFSMNICEVMRIFEEKDYKPNSYNIFLISEPKYRIVMSQGIRDKLINHVVGNILIETLEPSLIDTNVATRKEKGTHYGIKSLKKSLNELKGYEIYALKFDVSKYFYSIDHEILKEAVKKKIKDKNFLNILDVILNSTNSGVNDEINKLKEREINRLKGNGMSNMEERINEVKRIPLYEKGKGLPIGNLTSQILAIYYLNELDHYIKEQLHIKYYIRYMDDGLLLSHDKEYLQFCLSRIEKIMKKYKLKLNSKTQVINVSKEGVDFLGFRFYIKNNKVVMKVRKDTRKRFGKKMRLIKNNKMDYLKSISVIASYKGHLKWGNCYNLLHRFL